MSELLAPAGNIDAFYAAISNGADAIYVGLNSFSARAYAQNFTLEDLAFITKYAHLRSVKIYVAMNTILYDNELSDAYHTVDELANIGIDAIIVQDLALLYYITNHYSSLEAHISTQAGIDDLDGIKVVKSLGAKRVVLAREVSLEKIKEFKHLVKMEIETFIHGALCVSYSGDCYMSGLLGMRSGNRGRCVGCCRKLYNLVDETTNITYKPGYLLSMKDLNTSHEISKMRLIDSFKIEGRMKEATYVASIVKYYRDLLDGKHPNEENLYKSFQRTFTKGYLLGEDPKDITNIEKPNNYGFLIGTVSKINGNRITIKLNKPVVQNDQIRIESPNPLEEISIPLTKIYDTNGKLINSSDHLIQIDLKEKVKVGAKVYKTKDVEFLKEIGKTYPKEFKRFPLTIIVEGHIASTLKLYVKYEEYSVKVESEYIIEPAKTQGISEQNFKDLLSKLQDTPYYLDDIYVDFDNNAFIPLKVISNLKREAIEKLNELRLEKEVITRRPQKIKVSEYEVQTPYLTCQVSNASQYDAAASLGIKDIFFDNYISRNNAKYIETNNDLLVGGLNGIGHYAKTNIVTSDYSLNVVNSTSVALLHSLGVDKVTLSYEISKNDINNLVENYIKEYNTSPKLEVIAYGRQNLMVTKYCPLRRLGMCGSCKNHEYSLKDEIASFPITFNNDCTITILNSKILNLIDDLGDLKGITSFRLIFTKEDPQEVKRIITMFRNKLKNINEQTNYFDKEQNTRGYLNREVQ